MAVESLILVVEGRQTADSFYTSLHLEEEHSKRFRNLMAHRLEGLPSGEWKLPFDIADAFPKSMARQCTVRAVVLPRVTHLPHSVLRPATNAEALLRLAPSSVLQLPFVQSADALRRIAEMLRHVPSFWLDLGTDFDSIPLLVAEALSQATESGAMGYMRRTM